MWDIAEINKHKKYCLTRLSNQNLSEEEKIKLKLTIHSYLYMLDSSSTLCNTIFQKVVDIVSKGKYSLYRENKYNKFIDLDTSGSVKYTELIFLITLLMKLAETEINYEQVNFNKFDINSDELIYLAKNYYQNFLDEEISHLALNILNTSSNINFTKNMRYKKENIGGNMYRDYIFNKTYANIYLHQDINDYNSIVHEVMHCVDFSFNPKIPTKYHKVINEIPGYTSDFLFADYLDNIGFDKTETKKLKKQKIFTIYSLINNTFNRLKQNYYNMNNVEMTGYSPMEFIVKSLTPKIISELIEIKSLIVSYGLYLQIKNNPIYGFNNLKKYMKNGKPIESNLDFDYIELSNEKLMEIAEKFIYYSKNIINSSKKAYR